MVKLKFVRCTVFAFFIVSLAAVISTLLFQRYIAEAVISRVVGREVTISGEIDLRLGLVSHVRVTQFTVKNASWATHNNFLNVETAILSVDLKPLWRHERISAKLNLASPSVYLEQSETGKVNWHTASNRQEMLRPGPFYFELTVQHGLISYTDHAQPTTVKAHIDQLEAHFGIDQRLKMKSRGRLFDKAFELTATGEPVSKQNRTNAGNPYAFNLDIKTDTAHFNAEGNIARPLQLTGVDASISVDGKNFAELASLKDNATLALPFKLAGHLSGGVSRWTFSDFAGYLGKSEFRGDMSLDLHHEEPVANGRLVVNELHVGLFDDRAFQWSGTTQNDAMAHHFQLQSIAAFTAHAHVRIERVVGAVEQLGPVEFNLDTGHGVITVDPFHANVDHGSVLGKLHYETEGKLSKGTVLLRLDDVHVAPILHVISRAPGGSDLVNGVIDGELRLQFSSAGVDKASGQLQYKAPHARTFVTVALGRENIAGQWSLRADASGKVRGMPFKAAFAGQPFDLLEARDATWPFSLRGAIAKNRLKVQGYVTGTGEAFDVNVHFSGPGTKSLSTLTGMPLPSFPAYEVSANVAREPERLKFSRLDARIGDSHFTGGAMLDTRKGTPSANVDIRADNINYKDFDQLNTKHESSKRWIEKFDDLKATIRVKALRIVAPGDVVIENVLVKALLNAEILKFEPIQFSVGGGKVDVHARLKKSKHRFSGGTVKAEIKHVDMGEALKPLGLGDDMPGILNANIDFAFGPDLRKRTTTSTITYDDKKTGNDLAFVVRQSIDGLHVKGSGFLLKDPLFLRAQAGSLTDFFDGTPYRFDLRLHMLQTDVELKGSVRQPLALSGLQSTLVVAGPDPRKTAPVVGFQTPELPPYRLHGKLSHNNGEWRFSEINGKVGDSDLSGDITVVRNQDKPIVRARLHSSHLDFDDLGGVIGSPPDTKPEETSNADQRQRAAAQKNRGTVLPEKTLEFSVLSDFNAEIDYSAETVTSDTLPIKSLRLRLSSNQGQLLLKPIFHMKSGGTITAAVSLSASLEGQPANGHVEVKVSKIGLGTILERYAGLEDSRGKINGSLSLRTTGRSIAQMLGAMDGHATLTMSDGALDALIVELGGLDGGEALLLWLGDERLMKVRCARIDAMANNGVVRLETAVIDTTDTKFTMQGKIGFANETLHLLLKAHPKDFSMFVARTPFVIEGSFKRPTLHPSWSNLLLRGAAGILLGAISPPAALLALVEPGLGDDANCEELSD